MPYSQANQLIQTFVPYYGNLARSWKVLDFVMDASAANNQIDMIENSGFLFNGTGGKLRQVRMNYFPVQCDVDGSCDQTLCSEGEVIEPKQALFNIDDCYATKVVRLNKNDIRQIDDNTWDFNQVARQIFASMWPQARKGLALKILTKLYGLAGVHPDGNPEKRVTVTDPATGIVNPMGMLEIEREYQDAGLESPYILGGADVYNWQRMVGIGGLNAQGQYIDRADVSRSYYDDNLTASIFADDALGGYILSVAPTAIKYVWYSENAGIFKTDMASIDDLDKIYHSGRDGFIEGVLIDPVTGLPWDLYINYSKCGQYWDMFIRHRFDIFVMPDQNCGLSNGIMKWRTCPYVIAACPTGVTPSPAVTPSTFSWTPTLADLPIIANSTIAGFSAQLNQPETITTLADLAAYMTANSQYTFTVNGADIEYEGVQAITATFNNADVTATFS